MSEIDDLIHEQLKRHGVVELAPYAQREIAWLAGTGLAPDHEDDPRGPAVGAAMADALVSGEMKVVGLDETGKLVFMGTGRTGRPSREQRRRALRRGSCS